MRLIDADALIEDVRKNSVSYFADDFAHEWVDKQPTIEPKQPQIIHCKDCKYSTHEPCDGYDNDYICNRTPFSRSEGGRMPEEFCSRGERK